MLEKRGPCGPLDNTSVLFWVMAWYGEVTNHPLKQCRPRSVTPYYVINHMVVFISNFGFTERYNIFSHEYRTLMFTNDFDDDTAQALHFVFKTVTGFTLSSSCEKPKSTLFTTTFFIWRCKIYCINHMLYMKVWCQFLFQINPSKRIL